MKVEKVKAAALTTASKANQQSQSYHGSVSEATTKCRLGELLFLCLDTTFNQQYRKTCWQVLERQLRDYFQARELGVLS